MQNAMMTLMHVIHNVLFMFCNIILSIHKYNAYIYTYMYTSVFMIKCYKLFIRLYSLYKLAVS